MRIKVYLTLLRQRRKDLEFRIGFKDKLQKYESDEEDLYEKHRQSLAKIK